MCIRLYIVKSISKVCRHLHLTPELSISDRHIVSSREASAYKVRTWNTISKFLLGCVKHASASMCQHGFQPISVLVRFPIEMIDTVSRYTAIDRNTNRKQEALG